MLAAGWQFSLFFYTNGSKHRLIHFEKVLQIKLAASCVQTGGWLAAGCWLEAGWRWLVAGWFIDNICQFSLIFYPNESEGLYIPIKFYK